MTEKRRVLIIGGAGFMGAHLAEACLARGWSVVALDNLSTPPPEKILARLREQTGFRLVEADWLADGEERAGGESFHYVVHAATTRDTLADIRLHSEGVERALRLAARDGAVFLYLSSASVYGSVSAEPAVEDAASFRGTWTRPEGARGEARRFGEALTLAFAREKGREKGVEARVARLFEIYGPGMRENGSTPLSRWIAAARKGETMEVEGAERPYPLLHVEDAAEALTRLLRANFTLPLNVGHPVAEKAGDVAARVATLAGEGSAVETKRAPVGMKDAPLAQVPSIEAARRALGWEPKMPLDEGLASLFAEPTPRP